MGEEPDDFVKLTGCGHCGYKNPLHRCPCRAQYYCSKSCQRQDWKIHKPDCLIFSKIGEVPDVDGINKWRVQHGEFIKSTLSKFLGLSDPSRTANLLEKLVVVLIDFHPGQKTLKSRYSYSQTLILELSEVVAEGIEVNGRYYAIEQVAKDVQSVKNGAREFGERDENVFALFLCPFKPEGAVEATYSDALTTLTSKPLAKSRMFVVYDDDKEKTRRMKSTNVASNNPGLLGLTHWEELNQSLLHEIVVQELNLFDPANREKVNETACILNLDYDPSSSNPKDRFKIARLVGCFSFSELSSPPPSFPLTPYSNVSQWCREGRAQSDLAHSGAFYLSYVFLVPGHPEVIPTGIMCTDHQLRGRFLIKGFEPDPKWKERLLGE